MRTLAIRIPLNETDPEDVIGEIDKGNEAYLLDLLRERFTDIVLNVETGDSVFH